VSFLKARSSQVFSPERAGRRSRTSGRRKNSKEENLTTFFKTRKKVFKSRNRGQRNKSKEEANKFLALPEARIAITFTSFLSYKKRNINKTKQNKTKSKQNPHDA